MLGFIHLIYILLSKNFRFCRDAGKAFIIDASPPPRSFTAEISPFSGDAYNTAISLCHRLLLLSYFAWKQSLATAARDNFLKVAYVQ